MSPADPGLRLGRIGAWLNPLYGDDARTGLAIQAESLGYPNGVARVRPRAGHGWVSGVCSARARESGVMRAHSGRVRGSPKRGRTLLSKRVMAQIRLPERVRTSSPIA